MNLVCLFDRPGLVNLFLETVVVQRNPVHLVVELLVNPLFETHHGVGVSLNQRC